MTEPGANYSSTPTDKATSLRFAVMCNGTVFQRWQAEALKELHGHGHRVTLLIVDDRKVLPESRFRRILKKRPGTLLCSFLENRLFKPNAKQNTDLYKALKDVDKLECRVEQKGYSQYFKPSDVERIQLYQLDFILRFGFGIIRGEILNAARYGVWSFHHDDEMKYRGGPPGFWEIFRGDPVSGAVMQQLTDKLDGGIILKKGYLKTVMHSWKENLNQLLTVSAAWPAQVADEIGRSRAFDAGENMAPVFPASTTSAPVFRVPGNLEMLRFLLLLFRNRIRFYCSELFAAEIWNVGIISRPIHEIALQVKKLTEQDVKWLPRGTRSGYLADPAGFFAGNQLHILAEDYSYITQKARISEIVCQPGPEGVVLPGTSDVKATVIAGSSHLSYPFVFEHDSEVYCVPEAHQSGAITLYRRNNLDGTFVASHVLLHDVPAVDPTLFLYNDTWWLFFTGREQSNSHLYLYFAADLHSEFKPHLQNPVKVDVRSSRPAGTPFVHENVLYRPAQDCSVTYGGRIAMNKIVKLTLETFEEETVNHIDPVAGSRFSKGLHTLSSAGHITLVDGKAYKFDYWFFRHQFLKKMGRKEQGHV